MAARLRNIDLINNCDAFPDPVTEPDKYAAQMQQIYTLVFEDGEGQLPIGYMLKWVLDKIIEVPDDVKGYCKVDDGNRTVSMFREATEPERTRRATTLTQYLRDNHTFRLLAGWRDELWPVYGRDGKIIFSVERAAMGLFGNTRYGVHMTAYVPSPADSYGIKIWVPTRAATKLTYPGMLDNTVAGGLMTGEDPFECIIREADEEASLPDPLVRGNAKMVGNVSYIYLTDARSGGEDGYIYPEVQWVYDLELPVDVVPAPKDGEVESFSLLTIDQCKERLALGLFKPNCALVMLDFFVRHGILTPENEPHYEDIRRRVRRKLPFPGPHEHFY
ncbi:thiamine pyrophosphokinase [Pleurostoma richardsiae]|uniref:Thiamine pyrophosphokinase n=1 Tax=Pleurostoma richardsiae TaxID=41990 RepID=A0AA38S203_9PEZI|nr:thiamine pyrophosphokinase [Pleurostoma richardsiae]